MHDLGRVNYVTATDDETMEAFFKLSRYEGIIDVYKRQAFNSRELSDTSMFKNIGNNKLMLLVFMVTFALQVVITQFGGTLFGTVPLPPGLWLRIVLCALSVIAASELFKLAKRAFVKAKRID